MSASPYLHSCNELGVCQDRLHRCTDCQDAESSVRVIRMINSRRVHTIDEPVPFCSHRAIQDDDPIKRTPLRPSDQPSPLERAEAGGSLSKWHWLIAGTAWIGVLGSLALFAR